MNERDLIRNESLDVRKELHMEAAGYVKALKQDGLLCGWSEVSEGEVVQEG